MGVLRRRTVVMQAYSQMSNPSSTCPAPPGGPGLDHTDALRPYKASTAHAQAVRRTLQQRRECWASGKPFRQHHNDALTPLHPYRDSHELCDLWSIPMSIGGNSFLQMPVPEASGMPGPSLHRLCASQDQMAGLSDLQVLGATKVGAPDTNLLHPTRVHLLV